MWSSGQLGESVIEAVDVGDTVTILDLEGEFDMMSAPSIDEHRQRVLDRGRHLIINLSEATFIDSAVVHALFKANEAARKAGRVFVLQFGTDSIVERVLSVAAVHRTLETAPTLEKAIEVIDARTAASPVKVHRERAESERRAVSRHD